MACSLTSQILAESIVHTLDPFVFQISPGVGPRWYGIAYLAGFVVGWLVLRWLARSGRIPLSPRQVGDLVTNVIIGVIVGLAPAPPNGEAAAHMERDSIACD